VESHWKAGRFIHHWMAYVEGGLERARELRAVQVQLLQGGPLMEGQRQRATEPAVRHVDALHGMRALSSAECCQRVGQ
jgi:hypothetical protein